MSARERRPGTGGASNLMSARSQQSGRNCSSRPATTSHKNTHQQLNDPLVVNRKYAAYQIPQGKNKFPPTLNPNHERYPTVHPNANDNLKSKSVKTRPLTCPEAFIHANLNPTWEENPTYLPYVSRRTRTIAAQNFIEQNFEHMREYRPEYRDKTPRQLRKDLVSDKAFCSSMKELKRKECAIKKGTSSYHLRTVLRHPGNEHNSGNFGTKFDPFMTSINTSRESREDKINRMMMPSTHDMSQVKTYNRGYQHDSEFKNFSAFNGHLIKNMGTMLNR